jgi:hypothetical protein
MIVDISKRAAVQAARYFYQLHERALHELPANFATASKADQEKMIFHERAAMTYLWTLKELRP